jgi:hypothetical protein
VKDYIIIDDNENLLEHHLRRFVKTNTNLGMVQERYNHARELLLSYDQITNDTKVALEY